MEGKGSLLPGMDADLIIVDPKARSRVEHLHMGTDLSPFAGTELRGQINTVIANGDVLVSNGDWVAEKTAARYLKRRRLIA